MRASPAAILGLALATSASPAPAQSPATVLPGPPVVYRFAVPPRPVYVYSYQRPAPRYVRPPNPTGYRNRPYYGAYGYGIVANGSTDGFPPTRGRRGR